MKIIDWLIWPVNGNRTKLLPFVFLLTLLPFSFTACQKVERAHYGNGQIKYELPKNRKGELHGLARWWYPDGKLQLTADYTNGVLNGTMVRYAANGNVETEDQYLDGKLNGLSREMNPQGKIFLEKTYRNDTLHGPSRQYNEAGTVVIQGDYVHGYIDGHWLYFDRFGEVSGEGDFIMGKGIVKSYSRSGKLAAYCEYEDNLKHGREYYYDLEGNIVRSRIYDYGEMVSDSAVMIPPK